MWHAAPLRVSGPVHAGRTSQGRAAAASGAVPAAAAAGVRRRGLLSAAAPLRPQLLGAGNAAGLRQRDATRGVASERLVASYAPRGAQQPYRRATLTCGLHCGA